MAITQAQLDALVAAYMNTAQRVQSGTDSIYYRSLEDLAQQIAMASAALGVTNPLVPQSATGNRSFARFSKG